jgi:hypothetical protein
MRAAPLAPHNLHNRPMPANIAQLSQQLETMIDGASLCEVLEALEAVCHDKAEHLRNNWQDEPSARAWARAAKIVDKASASVEV